jgi:hypothetical protein
MRKLAKLWRALETIPGLCDVPAYWEHICGEDFPLVRPHLRPTDDFGARYPCPHPRNAECPRRIVDYEDGTFAARCRHSERLCSNLEIPPKEALIHELDVEGLIRPLADLLCVRYQQLRPRSRSIWEAGLSTSQPTRNQPVFLLVAATADNFVNGLRQVLLDSSGAFVAIAPTSSYLTVDLQQSLFRRQCQFVSMEDRVGLDDQGHFVAVEPTDTDEIPPTPVEHRTGVIEQYKRDHNCTAKAIQDASNVRAPDFYKWIKGELKNSSSKSLRIEQTLRLPLPKKLRK